MSHLAESAIAHILLPVEEPVGDLVGAGVGHNGHHSLQLLRGQLTGPAAAVSRRGAAIRGSFQGQLTQFRRSDRLHGVVRILSCIGRAGLPRADKDCCTQEGRWITAPVLALPEYPSPWDTINCAAVQRSAFAVQP